MDLRLVPKADLMLRRMNIDVDQGRVDLEEEDHDRVTPPDHEMAVPLQDGMLNDPVPDVAAIDERVDETGGGAIGRRPRNEPPEAQPAASFRLRGRQVLQQRTAQQSGDPLGRVVWR